MRRNSLKRISVFVLSALAFVALSATAQAQSGYKAEVLGSVSSLETKFVDLATKMPADKYGWRPAEGVRSVGEVFAHIASANYGIPGAFGAAPAEGVDRRAVGQLTDKDAIVSAVKASFAYVKKSVEGVPDAQLGDAIKMFGRDTTKRGAMLMMLEHAGEHLGQSIAYARSNGVVPPWSE
jgi:uncharacterized damage-inducible protein DinB